MFRMWSPPNASYTQKRYENRPMRIEDYEPGVSSLASRETNVVSFHFYSRWSSLSYLVRRLPFLF